METILRQKIGLGCMGMSISRNPEESVRTVRAALDEGISLFNTGEFYGMGESEMILRKALEGIPRDQYALSVKFGMLSDPAGVMYGMDTDAFHIKARLAYSMKRLGVDYIDLYQPARIDGAVPVEETVGALSELVSAGYIGHIGLSEVDGETLRRAAAVHPIHTVEMEYSLLDREIEKELMPEAARLGTGLLAFGLLSHGLLSDSVIEGKSQPILKFGRFAPENFEKNLVLLRKIKEIADGRGLTAAQLAYAWAFSKNPGIQCLVGTTRPEHLKNILKGCEVSLTAEEISAVEAAAAPGRIAGGGMRNVKFYSGRPVFSKP